MVPWVAFGEGVRYPNGTASRYLPRFFGVGFLDPYTESRATGIAAEGGTLKAVTVNAFSGGDARQACFYNPSLSQLVTLPDKDSFDESLVRGLTPDGALKVGYSRLPENSSRHAACLWDVENKWFALSFPPNNQPPPVEARAEAFAISANRDYIAGLSGYYEFRFNLPVALSEFATRWSIANGTPTVFENLAGYERCKAKDISADGSVLVGTCNSDQGKPTRAFRLLVGGTMEDLGALPGFDYSEATSISSDGKFVVGRCYNAQAVHTTAFRWTRENGMQPLYTFLPGDFSDDKDSGAEAISGTGAVSVGYVTGPDAGASYWETPAYLFSALGPALRNLYYLSVGNWSLDVATGISEDGISICGYGTDPEGRTQGWVAVLPPILHPPLLISIGPQLLQPGELFTRPINSIYSTVDNFSAEGLPPGFSIDPKSGIITGVWSTDRLAAHKYNVRVTATNKDGDGYMSFDLELVGPPGPPKKIEGHGFLPINAPPGDKIIPSSFGSALSANGSVGVGQNGQGFGNLNEQRAYRWTAREGITELPTMPGVFHLYSTAQAVSANGNTIVGEAMTTPDEDGLSHGEAAVWKAVSAANRANEKIKPKATVTAEAASAFSVQTLGVFPGAGSSIAKGVSADGTVVTGYGTFVENKYNGFQAFRWTTADGFVGLGWLPGSLKFSQAYGISPSGFTIVGIAADTNTVGGSSQAFRWTQAEGMVGLGRPADASYGRAVAVSADEKTIVGYNTFGSSPFTPGFKRAFRWTAAQGMIDLGVLPNAEYSEANALSADGSVIVGQSGVNFSPSRAFIWDKINGMRELRDVILADNPNLAGWKLASATGISADGTRIVGTGTNPNGETEGFSAQLVPDVPSQFLNISTRMRVLTGNNVLIGGFIVTGSEPKKVIVRGIGPSLAAAGLPGALADPTLELKQNSTTVAANDNWKEHQAEVEQTTIPPSHDLESAIVATLNPGAYTVILAGRNQGTGVGVVEIFDLSQGVNSKLANISSRGFVDTGDDIMIGGLIVGAGTGDGYTRILVRAIGPSLSNAGVSGALSDPTLELRNGNGGLMVFNDDWKFRSDGSSQQADIEATTVAPQNEKESAVVSTLAPGNYTAIVRGQSNATGIAVVEAYNLP